MLFGGSLIFCCFLDGGGRIKGRSIKKLLLVDILVKLIMRKEFFYKKMCVDSKIKQNN